MKYKINKQQYDTALLANNRCTKIFNVFIENNIYWLKCKKEFALLKLNWLKGHKVLMNGVLIDYPAFDSSLDKYSSVDPLSFKKIEDKNKRIKELKKELEGASSVINTYTEDYNTLREKYNSNFTYTTQITKADELGNTRCFKREMIMGRPAITRLLHCDNSKDLNNLYEEYHKVGPWLMKSVEYAPDGCKGKIYKFID